MSLLRRRGFFRRSALIIAAAVGLVAVASAFTLSACVGDDPTTGTSGTGDSGTATGDSSLPPNGDSSPGSGCGAATCSDPTTLRECDGGTTTCSLGCVDDGGAHCGALYPSGGFVLPTDLAVAGVLDVTIAASTTFTTDTGAIENVRGANVNPIAMEVISGIGYRLAKDGMGHNIGIWAFKSLTVPNAVVVHFTSTNGVALVATTTVNVAGFIDARGYDSNGMLCGHSDITGGVGGPGAGVGGQSASLPATGAGAGLPPNPVETYSGGASGGSYGGLGGVGGAPKIAGAGGDAGTTYGNAQITPLVGGSGGGGASFPGGGGGGALQIFASQQITIGGGASQGGLNAAGCNGITGSMGSPGGGGGSGGSILIETPDIQLAANGCVTVGGGGGGSGGGGTGAAAPGDCDGYGALGGGGTGNDGLGGGGSSPTFANGIGGNPAQNTSGTGGSGGGGSGRIRINNLSGSYTPPTGAVLKPNLGLAPNPPATVGSLDVR